MLKKVKYWQRQMKTRSDDEIKNNIDNSDVSTEMNKNRKSTARSRNNINMETNNVIVDDPYEKYRKNHKTIL